MKTTHLRFSVTALLVTASVGTAYAEPADVWSSTPTAASVAKATAAAPSPSVTALPTAVANVTAPVSAPVMVQPAVATANSPVTAMKSSYNYGSGATASTALPNAAAISSAPTVAADTNPVPQMSQKDLDERLWLAALAGNLGMVTDLISQGANPRISTRYGETAIHAAAARGHLQIIQFLAQKGVNINARTSN
ncbi:MAG TPA: ankyrin repeat domain-containing protein, partial [Thiolinea sp.]|nr:ankyrin repeat domain-containing protein [Thiolinea sp.]